MTAAVSKLDELARRAEDEHGQLTPDRVVRILGAGSFFAGVSECQTELRIIIDKSNSFLRHEAFRALAEAGRQEWWARNQAATEKARQEGKARSEAWIAKHPEDSERDEQGRLRLIEDESKYWVHHECMDPEYQRAKEGLIPTLMVEPCAWAVHDWFARVGTANPLQLTVPRYFGGGAESFEHDLRKLFSPLSEAAIASIISTWAGKLTWTQVRERTFVRPEDLLKHILQHKVGRYKSLEIVDAHDRFQPSPNPAAAAQPGEHVLWDASEPTLLPSARLAGLYGSSRGGSSSSKGGTSSARKETATGSKAPTQLGSKAALAPPKLSDTVLRELGLAAWSLAHARCWAVAAEACVLHLLTPEHGLHQQMMSNVHHRISPMCCPDWCTSVSESAPMRAVRADVRAWPGDAKYELKMIDICQTMERTVELQCIPRFSPSTSMRAFKLRGNVRTSG